MQLDILENNVEEGAVISVYRVGPMVDLCRGPHLPNTSYLKAIAITNASRAFWRGDTSKDGLQRVYGVTFTDKKAMAAYKHRIEEAKKRDHRLVGTQQDLFFFHQLSPGSCFFMPHGARIYNELIDYIRVRLASALKCR
jgi:threonyl-tRNA synthetase